MEGEDQVVREIDVYLSGHDLCSVLQFPLRPVFADPPIIESCQLKPVNKRLQVEVSNGTLNPQLHLSSVVCPNANLCAGVMLDGKALHLSPIRDVYQLRPSFDNVEFYDATEEDLKREGDDAPVAIQQVHVRPKETDRAKQSKEQSYAHLKKKEEEEPFRRLAVHPVDSDESNAYFERMYYNDNQSHEMPMEL